MQECENTQSTLTNTIQGMTREDQIKKVITFAKSCNNYCVYKINKFAAMSENEKKNSDMNIFGSKSNFCTNIILACGVEKSRPGSQNLFQNQNPPIPELTDDICKPLLCPIVKTNILPSNPTQTQIDDYNYQKNYCGL